MVLITKIEKLLFTASVLFFSANICAQSVQRQSINCMGSSSTQEGFTIHQAVGQPFIAKGFQSSEMDVNTGFIQFPSMNIKTVASDLKISATLFPNPATTSINISLDEVISEGLNIKVFDMKGQEVFAEYVSNFKNYAIACSTWQNGAYLIKIFNSKSSYTSKVIINKQ